MSGLRAAQAGISVVSANIANAQTPGYVRKTAVQVATAAGNDGSGVRIDAINRELDQFVQQQLQVESSGASYADLRAQFYDQLQNVYGAPGSNTSLDTLYNNFTSALQGLTTSPDLSSARSGVLSSAQAFTQQLNSMTTAVQGLRSQAELGIADAVAKANDAMQRIAQINQQLGTASPSDATTASLLDQRDQAIAQLSQLMDVKVTQNGGNQVTIFTNSGIQLVGDEAATLSFDAQGTMSAASTWSADPTKRTVGTISLTSATGGTVDLIANKSIHSGEIAAYVEMRDQVLTQAQSQLDELAAGMARALSDRTTAGTPVTGVQSGFDIDVGALLAGNSVNITYTDVGTNTQHTVTVVRVDDPAALPLANAATTNPNDKVVGVSFAAGIGSVASQLTAALGGTSLQFSNPSGTTLRILDDGVPNQIDVNAVSATTTATSLTGGSSELPFFLDGGSPYSGAITSSGSQSISIAGRIAVNANLLADPSRLVVFQTSPLTPAGDATRPNFLYDQLNSGVQMFSPQTGMGTSATPFSGTLPTFLRQILSQQGDAAQAADNLKQGQDVVLNSLQQRFNDSAGVSIDQEMSNLLNLQNSYSANARVLSAVNDMFKILMQM